VAVVKESRACVVHCVAAGGPDVLATVYAGMDDSGPKVPVEATKVLIECIAAFGAFAFPVKGLCGKLVGQLDKPDKAVKEAAQKLLFELCKWLGQPCLEFLINKLKDKEKEELLKKLAEGGPGTKPADMKPIRELKIKGPEVKFEFDKDRNLLLDMVEPVDMNELLKGKDLADWKTKVTAEKWNEKVEGMVMIVKACGSPPKLLDKDYSEVIDVMKELCKDKMIAVAIAAFNTLGVVADGMGANFAKYTKHFVPLMMPRMKDAKLVSPALVAFGKMYGRCLATKDVFGGVQEFVLPSKPENKMPPHTSVGGVALLADFVAKDKVPLTKDEWGDLGAFSFTIVQKVSDPKVKKANLELMVNLLAREKKEGNDLVKKLVAPLADSKAAADKKLFKQLWAAADPEAAAAEEAAKKAADEEKKKSADDKKAAGKKKKDEPGEGDKPKKKKKKGPSEEELKAKEDEERAAKEAEEAAKGGPALVMTEPEAIELLKLCFAEADGAPAIGELATAPSAAAAANASAIDVLAAAAPSRLPQPLAPGAVLWKVVAAAKVYDQATSKESLQVATLAAGHACAVLKTDGNWHCVQPVWRADGAGEGWFQFQSKDGKLKAELAADAAAAEADWTQQQVDLIAAADQAAAAAAAAVSPPGELSLLPPGAQANPGEPPGAQVAGAAAQPNEAAPPEPSPPSRPPQPPAGGGAFWMLLKAKKGYDKATSKESAEVASLKGLQIVHVLKTEGNWHCIQNVWSTGAAAECWYQFTDKKGAKFSELASDQVDAQASWTKAQEAFIAKEDAAAASAPAAGAAAATATGATVAAAAPGAAAGQVGAVAASGEEAPGAVVVDDTPREDERVVPTFSQLLKNLSGADARAKAKACEALGWGHFKGKVASRSAAAVALMRVKCGDGDWKREKHAEVYKGCFLGVQALARQSRRAGGAAEALQAQQERNARLAYLREQQEIAVDDEVR
jgi:hypothetical protein